MYKIFNVCYNEIGGMDMFENKKIFVLGMARSGYEAAKVLVSHHNQVFITDQKEQDKNHIKELESLGVTFVVSDHPEDYLDEQYDYVVKNPGITYEHAVCKKAEALHIPVTNEVEVAYSYLPKNVKIIGITGSNGKTTTTTITYEILKAAGLPVHLGGNIGYPVCSLVKDVKEGDILVLEISGHQQHDFIHFKTDISVMTNLSPVHLDFFHTYENYKFNKSYILRNTSLSILNKDNEDVLEVSKDVSCKKLYFSSKQTADCFYKDGKIYYQGEEILESKDIRIKGVHNMENIMCAYLVAKEFHVSNEVIKNVLKEFKGVEHRIEYVDTIEGVEFYNDSKSTNVKSTQIALNTFQNPTILLLGGLDRGHSFEDLKTYLSHVKLIVCYGETKDRILEFAQKVKIPCEKKDTLEESVVYAYEKAEVGDVVLLSPACASWDQYSSFEVRGREFKQVVNSFKDEHEKHS